MLSEKKLLTKMLSIIEDFTSGSRFIPVEMSNSATIAAGGTGNITCSFPAPYNDGTWRALLLTNISIDGGGSGNIVMRGFGISNGSKTVNVEVRNIGSSSFTVTAHIWAQFIKLGGVIRNNIYVNLLTPFRKVVGVC